MMKCRLRYLTLKRIMKSLRPNHVDFVLYEAQVGSYEPQRCAKVELEIKKSQERGIVHYDVFVKGDFAHRSDLRCDNYLPLQFGYGRYPIIGDCVTNPQYRGLGIYPHVLGYIIRDVQSSQEAERLFVLVAPNNTASIKGIERAGLKQVARLKGLRVGPLVLNRSGHSRQIRERD